MSYKIMFLYVAIIACIPLSLELWDRYKPVRSFEVGDSSYAKIYDAKLGTGVYEIAGNQHNMGDLFSVYNGFDTVWMQVDPITFTAHPYQFKCPCDAQFNPILEHSHIPKAAKKKIKVKMQVEVPIPDHPKRRNGFLLNRLYDEYGLVPIPSDSDYAEAMQRRDNWRRRNEQKDSVRINRIDTLHS